MNFWQIFLRVLPWRPIAALFAAWYHVSGRRVRARNRLRAAGAALPFAYDLWMRNAEQEEAVAAHAGQERAPWLTELSFSVIIDARGRDDRLVATSIASIKRQSVQLRTESIVLSANAPTAGRTPSPRSIGDALAVAKGEFVLVLSAGSQLSRNALFRIAEGIRSLPNVALIYGDEDKIEAGRRSAAWFKPQWNRELFLAMDYISSACALRTSVARRAIEQLNDDDLSLTAIVLQVAAADERKILNVPHILVHLEGDQLRDPSTHERAVTAAVKLEGGIVSRAPYNTLKVSWPLPDQDPPLVSIIIPTRDRVGLLRACVTSLLERTNYAPVEVLIVDNGSSNASTHAYLEIIRNDPRVRVIAAPGPYNYSALNNQAAEVASGKFLCLLNNDTEVINGDWLTEMMRHAVRPEVGAVGAKLLYTDRTIQHAGVVVGIGDAAGHAHRYLREGDRGYFALPHSTHYVSAVTGACLLVSKEKFQSVGGLDAEAFAVAYNDVDLCLKLETAGFRNVYVPHAVLIHQESKSRGKDHSPSQIDRYRAELRRFQERWGADDYRDPLLNPNLDRSSETFLIRF
jgi:O-antigen biosynthesis protein